IAGQPELAISHKPAGRKGNTEIIIEQKQKYLYTFSINLLINTGSGSENITVPVTERVTRFTVKDGDVKDIVTDPGTDLLFSDVTGN
ncbi:MAG TPA: hypothetical protein VJ963_00790, partial [Bacteroidales bacterium]|nr:hypothetical protein [Bacteroidales bacterium]